MAEYASVKEKYEFLDGQRKDLTEAISSLKRIIGETDQKIRSDFRKCFDTVSRHFQSVFTELFGGGKARISLVGDDPLEAGIEIAVQPPGKKLQNMNLLSGGEKTMTAVALMFAVLRRSRHLSAFSTRWKRLWMKRISDVLPVIWKISAEFSLFW